MSISSGVRDEPKIYELSVRTFPERGGPVSVAVKDADGLAAGLWRHLLILVHGFNNTAPEARASYNILIDQLWPSLIASRVAPDAIACFQWPGDAAAWFKLLDCILYARDVGLSFSAADRLTSYLAGLARLGTGSRKISIIGHSLGCRLVLEMLARLAPVNLQFDVIALMAAAVPTERVEVGDPLAGTATRPIIMRKFFSEQDSVLELGFPVGQQLAFMQGIDPSPGLEAVGRHGNPGSFGAPKLTTNGHGDYWADPRVADCILQDIDPTLSSGPTARELLGRPLPASPATPQRTLSQRRLP